MLIKLNFESEIPLYLQLRNQIVTGIGFGILKPEEPLPSVRQLGADLGVNPLTINKAYTLLKAEGFIQIDRRKGAKVSARSDGVVTTDIEKYKEKLVDELSLVISEASLKGIGEEEFMKICGNIHRKKGGLLNENPIWN